ncbi:MAG: BLUF domain-containing protein [Leeuwenhoekiella sp.]
MIYSLAYVSYSAESLNQSNLTEIFEYTEDWNINHNISGFLVHNNRNFVQLLEGDEQEIKDLFSRISIDKRHRDIFVILEQELPQRAFDGYKSGFLISDSRLHTELKEYLDYLKLLEDNKIDKTIGVIEEILKGM